MRMPARAACVCEHEIVWPLEKHAHAGSRTRVTSMGGLYDAATLHALLHAKACNHPVDAGALSAKRCLHTIFISAPLAILFVDGRVSQMHVLGTWAATTNLCVFPAW